MSRIWENRTPHEQAEAVRAHAKLDLRFADLCKLFNLTAEGVWQIVVKGDDWRLEYDMDRERERRLVLIREACRAA
jgi:hypothetical protein